MSDVYAQLNLMCDYSHVYEGVYWNLMASWLHQLAVASRPGSVVSVGITSGADLSADLSVTGVGEVGNVPLAIVWPSC